MVYLFGEEGSKITTHPILVSPWRLEGLGGRESKYFFLGPKVQNTFKYFDLYMFKLNVT
jgi:hypothetical protein